MNGGANVMRLIITAAASLLLATAAHADTMHNCAAAWKAKSADAVAAKTYKAMVYDLPEG
jgi:hypothetical protein